MTTVNGHSRESRTFDFNITGMCREVLVHVSIWNMRYAILTTDVVIVVILCFGDSFLKVGEVSGLLSIKWHWLRLVFGKTRKHLNEGYKWLLETVRVFLLVATSTNLLLGTEGTLYPSVPEFILMSPKRSSRVFELAEREEVSPWIFKEAHNIHQILLSVKTRDKARRC